ncbi:MAG: thioredoxin family protein [Candidatus Hermodarchaeota archaeon]
MTISNVYKRMIQVESKKLTKPVNLKIFTSSSNLQESVRMLEVIEIYKKASNGLIKTKEYRIETNSELAKKYNIQQAPAILFVNSEDSPIIRYLAVPSAAKIQPFVETLKVFTGAPNYYENAIKDKLDIINPSVIKVLITDYCAYCSTIISICSLFTLASEGKLQTDIIDIMTYPEIGEQYEVTTVPTLVINEDKIIVGNVTAEELLYEILNKSFRIKN